MKKLLDWIWLKYIATHEERQTLLNLRYKKVQEEWDKKGIEYKNVYQDKTF